MNRWRQRLAELRTADEQRSEGPAPSLHNVQIVQNGQKDLEASNFGRSERFEQRTEEGRADSVYDWRVRLKAHLSRARPDGVPLERWGRARAGALRFAEEWADKAISHGWSEDELFALVEPFANVSMQGAAWFVGDAVIVGVSPTGIGVCTASGATQTIYRASLDSAVRSLNVGERRV